MVLVKLHWWETFRNTTTTITIANHDDEELVQVDDNDKDCFYFYGTATTKAITIMYNLMIVSIDKQSFKGCWWLVINQPEAVNENLLLN